MMGTRSGLKRGLTWGNAVRGVALLRRLVGALAGGQSAGRAKSRNRGGSGRPSHVLRAIGLDDAQAKSSIRLGFGRYSTLAELAEAVEEITKAAEHQDNL